MSELGDILLCPDNSLAKRIRALHDIRECTIPTSVRVDYLIRASKTTKNVLFLHEIMYELGQIGTESEIPFLENVMLDASQDVVTRHEAGEALGAIQSPKAIQILRHVCSSYEKSLASIPIEVAETCILALRRIGASNAVDNLSKYSSIDPAVPHLSKSIQDMRKLLSQNHLDGSVTLYDRYMALFRLREENDVEGLCQALQSDNTSALLRHEIAFVLGQMESDRSVSHLCDVLENSNEHPMVRHEAAEALGAIATPQCLTAIQKCLQNPDENELVTDSCVIALDMYEYYKSWSNANR